MKENALVVHRHDIVKWTFGVYLAGTNDCVSLPLSLCRRSLVELIINQTGRHYKDKMLTWCRYMRLGSIDLPYIYFIGTVARESLY